jgi:hypothetical protein
MSEVALEGVLMADAGDLRTEAEAGLKAVAQALPGMGLTAFQTALVLRVLEYEIMRLEEGWVDDYMVDLAAQLAGSP